MNLKKQIETRIWKLQTSYNRFSIPFNHNVFFVSTIKNHVFVYGTELQLIIFNGGKIEIPQIYYKLLDFEKSIVNESSIYANIVWYLYNLSSAQDFLEIMKCKFECYRM